MQIWRKPWFIGQASKEIWINFGRIDGGQAQSLQIRNKLQEAGNELAKCWQTRQILAPSRQIHARQHNFSRTGRNELFNCSDHFSGGGGATGASAKRDDAECTAVVASVLHFDIGARTTGFTGRQMASCFREALNVVHTNALC